MYKIVDILRIHGVRVLLSCDPRGHDSDLSAHFHSWDKKAAQVISGDDPHLARVNIWKSGI